MGVPRNEGGRCAIPGCGKSPMDMGHFTHSWCGPSRKFLSGLLFGSPPLQARKTLDRFPGKEVN